MKNIGQLIDYDFELREKIRELGKKVDALKEEREKVEKQILEAMDEQTLPRASGTKATASVIEQVVGHVQDWDRFYGFITRTKAFHLLERRIASAPYREELKARGKPIPGVVPYTKRTIGLRAD